MSDQQAGGAILWMIPLIPYSILAVGLATRWLSEEGSEALSGRLRPVAQAKVSLAVPARSEMTVS